jgi:hypothetical protein
VYGRLFLSEHYTIIQGAQNLRFCMTGEVSIDKIKAGRAVTSRSDRTYNYVVHNIHGMQGAKMEPNKSREAISV